MRFTNTVSIERPVHEVFAYVSDLRNVPAWNDAIAETRQVNDGPVHVGTTYRQLRTVPSRSEEMLEVTALEPDRRFAVRGDLGPFTGTLTYELEEVGGVTRLTNTADLEAHGVLRLAGAVATGRVREAVGANLGKLKELLERDA